MLPPEMVRLTARPDTRSPVLISTLESSIVSQLCRSSTLRSVIVPPMNRSVSAPAPPSSLTLPCDRPLPPVKNVSVSFPVPMSILPAFLPILPPALTVMASAPASMEISPEMLAPELTVMLSAPAPSSTLPLTRAPAFAMTSLFALKPSIAVVVPLTSAPLFSVIVTVLPDEALVDIPPSPSIRPDTEMSVVPLPLWTTSTALLRRDVTEPTEMVRLPAPLAST